MPGENIDTVVFSSCFNTWKDTMPILTYLIQEVLWVSGSSQVILLTQKPTIHQLPFSLVGVTRPVRDPQVIFIMVTPYLDQ